MDKSRKNTLRIVFGQGVKVPMYMDVLRFVGKTLKLSQASVHSIYKDEAEQRFYIKFMDEVGFNQFTRKMEDRYVFDYVDCSTTSVHLEVASSLFRYVRIFSLLPEIEDKEIATALEKYGVIRQHVREKYPADSGFVVYNGIRGVHMEISKELPANLFIGHCKARLYYEGLKNKCFYCKAEGHLKAECPKLADLKARQNGGTSTQSGSYSQVLTNAIIAANPSQPVDQLNMTAFPIIGNPNQKKETTQATAEVDAAKPLPNASGPSVILMDTSESPNADDLNRTMTNQATGQPEEAKPTSNASGATTAAAVDGVQSVQPNAGKPKDTTKRPTESSSEGSGSEDKPPKKQQFVLPKTPDSPIDALGRRSRTKDRANSTSRIPRRSRSGNKK